MAENRTTAQLDTINAVVLVQKFSKPLKMQLRTFWLLDLVQLHRENSGMALDFRSTL